jgi:hypothetical protein
VTDAPVQWVPAEPESDSTWRFVAMPPGWHVTTGPGAIVFDTTVTAAGRFTLEAEMFAFPDSRASEYGVFAGGVGLDAGAPSYTAFVLRRDGFAAVINRAGDTTTVVVPWVRKDSIQAVTVDRMARNVLRVEAQATRVAFLVNGATVAEVPREAGSLAGRFGFRVGEGMNVHASRLDLTTHLAP